jgi:hypothetical protein
MFLYTLKYVERIVPGKTFSAKLRAALVEAGLVCKEAECAAAATTHTTPHHPAVPLPVPAAAPQRLLRGEAPEPMAPWYRGFRGDVAEVPSKTAGKSYNISGTASQVRMRAHAGRMQAHAGTGRCPAGGSRGSLGCDGRGKGLLGVRKGQLRHL